MAGLFTIYGDDEVFARYLHQNPVAPALSLHLFTNDYDPTDTDVIGFFTECAFTGYSSVSLTNGSWVPTDTSGIGSVWAYPTISWTFTDGGDLFGYWVQDDNTAAVIYAERFAGAPITVPSIGGVFQLSTQVQVHTCP